MTIHRLAMAGLALIVLVMPWTGPAHAHEFKLDAVVSTYVKTDDGQKAHLLVRAPLYLFKADRFPVKGTEVDIAQSGAAMQRALASLERSISLMEDGRPLPVHAAVGRLSLPSDRSFEAYGTAASHIDTPPKPDLGIVIDQGYVDAHLVYTMAPAGSTFPVHSLRTNIAPELGPYLKLTIRYIGAGGESRALMVKGGAGTVDLNPGWIGAAKGFVGLGVAHILTGWDHLLFLLCLVIPLRNLRQLLTVVTGFTAAHSFTLIGSAYGLVPGGAWFPPFVELMIAASIVYTALENIVGVDVRRRVLLTLAFGLVHGFGFSYGLAEQLQFAGSHLLLSLLAFNLGIELGQVLVLALMLPLLAWVGRHMLAGQIGSIVMAALLAHVGWHWMTDRWDALVAQPWPVPTTAGVAAVAACVAGAALIGMAGMRLLARLGVEARPRPSDRRRPQERPTPASETAAAPGE